MSDSESLLLTPAPDFTTPLELLHACHGRIEAQCATLLKLPDHVRGHGADVRAQQAAAAILRYFSTAARHHHEDEEQDVFPLVRARAVADGNAPVLALLECLQTQHRDMESAWNLLAPWLKALSRGELSEIDATAIAGFAAEYRAHIAREEQEFLPYCRKVLKPEQLAAVGASMARRRGVKLSGEWLV